MLCSQHSHGYDFMPVIFVLMKGKESEFFFQNFIFVNKYGGRGTIFERVYQVLFIFYLMFFCLKPKKIKNENLTVLHWISRFSEEKNKNLQVLAFQRLAGLVICHLYQRKEKSNRVDQTLFMEELRKKKGNGRRRVKTKS